MKRKDEFSQIHELLKELPKIEDQRDKEDIYRNIQQQVNETKPKKFNAKYVLPVVVACILLLSFSPLLFMEMNQSRTYEKSTSQISSYDMKEKSILNHDVGLNESDTDALKTTDVTVAMISKEQKVVPITVIVEDAGQNPLELVKEASLALSEDQEEYISTEPIFDAIQIEENQQTAIIEINDDNREYFTEYKTVVEEVILFNFAQNDLKTIIYEDRAKMTDTKLVGESEIVEQTNEQTSERKPYYAYVAEDGTQMLIQDGETADSLAYAIEQMKNTSNPSFETLLSTEQNISVKEENEQSIIITFEEPVDLTSKHELFIEAFLQLANQFGYTQVKFDNMIQDEWQDYNLSTSIDIE